MNIALEAGQEPVCVLAASRLAFRSTAGLPERTMTLSFIQVRPDHETAIAAWARWALDPTAEWNSPTDPGPWDYRTVFGT